jgi:hypothetical protein
MIKYKAIMRLIETTDSKKSEGRSVFLTPSPWYLPMTVSPVPDP